MTKKLLLCTLTFVLVLIGIQSCRTNQFRSNYKDANSLLHETENIKTKPYLKAHLKNGDVCILKDSWQIDTISNVIIGNGTLYDFNRSKVRAGSMDIKIDSVAIFETNTKLIKTEVERAAALTILTALNLELSLYCIANPKACFGSCPTFYIHENHHLHYADAEGFSNAICPSMEYGDIDAIGQQRIEHDTFSLTMKNEALETHCINQVKILAYPLQEGERVYQSPKDHFYLCGEHYPISQAKADEGDITLLLKSQDLQERFSLSDKKNLSSKEEIFLTFDHVTGADKLGLILNFRQTIMTTFLFYNAMGYMGEKVGDVFAILETDEKMRAKFDATTKELGNIEIYLWNELSKKWEHKGGFNETGPIAINKQFIPLQQVPTDKTVKIKLVLNRGLWRIDYAALAAIHQSVSPFEVNPTSILDKGKMDNEALHKISQPDQYLISMPGSEYKFNFILPASNTDYELFLYSKGYYLEWMREQWIQDKNILKLRQMVYRPKKHLRSQARNYKQYEATMEQEFWNSRIDTKIFSYYEK